MHTLSAFYAAATADPSVDAQVNAVNDQYVQVRAGRYQFMQDRIVLGALAGVLNGSRVFYDYPSALRITTPVIDPIDADGIGGNLPAMVWYGTRGLVLPRQEDIGIFQSRAGGGAADVAVFLFTTPQFTPAGSGMITTIRGTSNSTGGAGAWALGTITLDRPLPKGRYEVVGMRVTGANVAAARLVFPGGGERPGCIANVAPTAYVAPFTRFGAAGRYGFFDNYLLPQIECIGTGAMAAQAVSLDIIAQVGG